MTEQHYPPYPWQALQWDTLQTRWQSGRVPHALLLSGAPGLGKYAFARAVAQRALCHAAAAPCGVCPACRQFTAGSHPDYFELGVEEDKKDIAIDQVRELIGQLALTASGTERWKVAVLAPAERLNRASANALLKTLEEPAPRTLLILVTSQPSRLLPTLRSRCQQMAFPVPEATAASAWLAGQGGKQPWPVLLRLAGGAPLAALELAGSPLAAARPQLARQLAGIETGREDPVALAAEWLKLGAAGVLDWLASWVMDLILLRQTGQDGRLHNPDMQDVLQTQAQGIHLEALHRYLDAVRRNRALLDTTLNDQLLLEALLLPWASGLDDTMQALLPHND